MSITKIKRKPSIIALVIIANIFSVTVSIQCNISLDEIFDIQFFFDKNTTTYSCQVFDDLRTTSNLVYNNAIILSQINLNLLLSRDYLTNISIQDFRVSKPQINALICKITTAKLNLDHIFDIKSVKVVVESSKCLSDNDVERLFKYCEINSDDLKKVLYNFGLKDQNDTGSDDCTLYVKMLRRFGGDIRGSRFYTDKFENVNETLPILYENLSEREPLPRTKSGCLKTPQLTTVLQVAINSYFKKWDAIIKTKKEQIDFLIGCEQEKYAQILKEELADKLY